MTYELQTLNKGEIEAGYFSIFVQEVRVGDFSIPTDKFCNFVAELATGKNRLKVPTSEGEIVKGSWNSEKKIVRLGPYEIDGREFGEFADYVFNGGFLGWNPKQPGWKPDFVESAISYVREHMGEAQRDSYLNSAQQKHLPRLEDKL